VRAPCDAADASGSSGLSKALQTLQPRKIASKAGPLLPGRAVLAKIEDDVVEAEASQGARNARLAPQERPPRVLEHSKGAAESTDLKTQGRNGCEVVAFLKLLLVDVAKIG
jgi:hypothetical protein